MEQRYTIEQLQAVGGKLWEKNEKRRVYFNDLSEMFGLSCGYYNTGNISSASLDGKSISNCRAREISFSLNTGKLWFDLNDQKFHCQIPSCRDYSSNDFFTALVNTIKSKIETPATTEVIA